MTGPGPLGIDPVVSSTWLGPPESLMGFVVGMTFDSANNLLIAARTIKAAAFRRLFRTEK